MPTKSEVIENLNWVTQRISDRVWTISVGVVAASLTYIIESANNSRDPFLQPQQVTAPAALALLSLACDLTQYMAANRQNYMLLRKMEKQGLEAARYETSAFLMRVRMITYRAKFYLCIAAVGWIVVATIVRTLQVV